MLQLIEALSHNTTFGKEFLHKFLDTHLKEMLENNLKSFFKYTAKNLYKLFIYLLKLEYFDKEIFEFTVKNIVKRKYAGGFEQIISIYESLSKLQKEKKYHRDLSPEVETLKEILKNDVDFRWRYNADELRYYSYFELKATRNDYQRTAFSVFFEKIK